MTEGGSPAPFRSGFVSILGLPNAGKSTLLNALVGAKLAIVADKPQTTQTTIQGVLTLEGAQVVFLDTPGIHRADSPFNRRMMETVRAALRQRDLLLYVADAMNPAPERERDAVAMVRESRTPAILVFNKIDRVKDKRNLLAPLERFRALHDFEEYIPISALTGEGVDVLRNAIVRRLPEGPAYFPPDHITDQPERFLGAELIREKILNATRREVPHSVAVLVDKWEETGRLIRIFATVYVEKEGQKGIVIGAGGATLKRVGTEARLEMEQIFGRKVFLDLRVKLRPHWRDTPDFLDALDWRTMAGSHEI